jgi:aconitate hydratase 2 / 2-methylisocitrate dehydratase
LGIPPLSLDAEQTSVLCELLKNPPAGGEANLLSLLRDRVPPGVDPAAYVKAGFLTSITTGKVTCPLIDKVEANGLPSASAIELLGTMLGGYNVRSILAEIQ